MKKAEFLTDRPKKNSLKKIILSKLILDRGILNSLDEIRAYTLAGKILVNDQRINSPFIKVSEEVQIRIKDRKSTVSRAGEKLSGCVNELNKTNLFTDAVVLDIGSSTGGFTEFCLNNGSKKVFSIDVGTNQLDWKLRKDSRVISLEKTDIRNLKPDQIDMPNIVCCDVSFISLTLVIPEILRLLAGTTECHLFLLIKPQFELSKRDIPVGGVIDSLVLREKAIAKIVDLAKNLQFLEITTKQSRIKGKNGNIETFLYAKYQKA